jgi:hypothetical protein
MVCGDFETYFDHEGRTRVYSGAWYSVDHTGEERRHIYWLPDYNWDSDELIAAFFIDITFYTKEQHQLWGRNVSVYFHNNSSFDSLLYMRVLETLHPIRATIHNSKIISISVYAEDPSTVKKGSRARLLYDIRDSMLILPSSLGSLCKGYNVSTPKEYSPHYFFDLRKGRTIEEILTYKGPKLGYEYYEPKRVSITEWESLPADYDVERDEKGYVLVDCISLHQVLTTFFSEITQRYGIPRVQIFSSPGLSLRIWRTHYMPSGRGAPRIYNLRRSADSLLRTAYAGGYTETMHPRLKDGYHYDVKSMYPHAMKNDMPVGKPYFLTRNEYESQYGPTLGSDFFGFVCCTVKTPSDLYTPLLGVRRFERYIHPLGIFRGFWFSEELRLALDSGYEIERIHFAVRFERGRVFDTYIDHVYSMKASEDAKKASKDPSYSPARREISKLLMNSLYGRIGMKPSVTYTSIISDSDTEAWSSVGEIVNMYGLSEGRQLVTYTKAGDTSEPKFESNCAVSAAITAYSHVHLWRMMLMVGQRVWMTDTDSIVTDTPLPDSFLGTNLGDMELESRIREALFVSPKVYAELRDDGSLKKCSKGCSPSLLSYSDYESLVQGDTLVLQPNRWYRNPVAGHLILRPNKFTLRSVITKRERVYDADGVWVDTVPLVLRETGTAFERTITGMPKPR